MSDKVRCMPEVVDKELVSALEAREGQFYVCDFWEKVLPRIANHWEQWKGVYANCLIKTELALQREKLRMEAEGRRMIYVADRALHLQGVRKILHQVWIQGAAQLPEDFARNRELWREALPADWTMMLWDDAMARDRWADYAAHGGKCRHHAGRADLILARCSRDFGGLCTGTDCVPVNAAGLLRFLDANDTMLVLDARHRSVSNGLVWSAQPGHAFFDCVTRHQLRSDGAHLGSKDIPKATGPGCYWDALLARDWDLSLVSSRRAYTHHWNNRKDVNAEGWVNPGYAASWWQA